MSVKTRQVSACPLADYLGPGKELLGTELPTLRSALQHALYLQDQKMRLEEIHKKNYPVSQLMKDVSSDVITTYQRANNQFQPPVIINQRSLERKLSNFWELSKRAAHKKLYGEKKDKLEEKLDSLLDIINCKCVIMLCAEAGCCPPCSRQAHIDCSCPKQAKIPVIELSFVLAQRTKKGEKGKIMIAGADYVEDAKQTAKRARNIIENHRISEKKRKKEDDDIELEERTQEELQNTPEEPTATVEENEPMNQDIIQKRNMMDLTNTARTTMRYELSTRSSAATCSAFLSDLIQAGEISPSKSYLAVDPRKMQRARDRALAESSAVGEDQTLEDNIKNIMFDSRLDQTKVRSFDEETGQFYPRVKTEDHYTLTDGDGRFVVHLTKPSKTEEETEEVVQETEEVDQETEEADQESDDGEANKPEETSEEKSRRKRLEKIIGSNPKPALAVALLMYEWMKAHGVDKTLQFLSGDSTNSNTGWKGGIIAWLEKLLGRKVTWLICQLHCNELGLRHLFAELDGKTSSKTGWSGPLGQLLKSLSKMEINPNFKQIDVGPEMTDLPEEVNGDLSSDQGLLRLRTRAVRSGHLPREVALRKAGSVVHSRWVTFASEVLLLWMSAHGLVGEELMILETVVIYIVSVYVPMWFEIKVKHSWVEGPRHVLTHLGRLKLQSPEVQGILLPYLRTSSWFAHSEAILQTMLCSEDKDERVFAVNKILEMRGKKALGCSKPRKRKLPKLNTDATSLKNLICWDKPHEPLLTCTLSKHEISALKDKPMEVEYFCGHTQAIERAVKEVIVLYCFALLH